jgi:hypothetical protein
VIGKRVYLEPDSDGLPRLKPGEYLFVSKGFWLACTPNDHHGDLSAHEVTEHADGTITVRPSIRVSTSYDKGKTTVELWHGFLERGVWRECP